MFGSRGQFKAGKRTTGVVNHDKEDAEVLRRAAVIAGGLAMATSFTLAGAGTASAAAPGLKEIKPGATWTIEINHGGCEQAVFNTTTHHFTSDLFGDKGTWSGGGSKLSMTWKAGAHSGVTYSGDFVSTTTPVEYKGLANDGGVTGKTKVVKGAVATWNGITC